MFAKGLTGHDYHFNTLSPDQNGYHYVQGIFKWMYFFYFDEVGLRYFVKAPIDNMSILDQVMYWCQMGD